jgi:hypothetical protein
MSLAVVVHAEDSEGVFGTNFLKFFGCPQSTPLTVLVLAEDPEGVLEMGLDVRFPALLSHDEHKITEVQGSRPVICTTDRALPSNVFTAKKKSMQKYYFITVSCILNFYFSEIKKRS